MQHNRAPPPAYPEKLTIALLGKKIQIKNVIGNLILNDQGYFTSESDPLVVRENISARVINTPDFFDAECPNPDQRIIDFMALSQPGLDLFILVLDPENAREEEVVGQISKLQDVFGEQITKHLVVMFPDLERLQALAHLKEIFNVLLVVPDHLPTQCRDWCPRGHPFVYQYKDYSQDVVLRRKAAIEKRRANNNCGSGDADETGPATLKHNFATAAPISM
ncbi:uncharacterized protein LOC128425263 isoform X1 [Pleuronectes platessa]|uniref:uncharacterized protein LOC128425263 isoform X1 n=1 Tax=Pleuronectes platessa TaxID=8262 RepID=UPI00232A5D21|nr:uncharacterized protein LOC128425263 isoform X1 [Pleuronectes platessa]